MAPSNGPITHAPSHSAILQSPLQASSPTHAHAHENGTTLIARAEALNAFMKMQPAADQARNEVSSPRGAGGPAAHAALSSGSTGGGKRGINHTQAASPTTSRGGHHQRGTGTVPSSSTHRPPTQPSDSSPTGCFCFGGGNSHSGGHGTSHGNGKIDAHSKHLHQQQPPKREYYPDNLSVQPEPHPWDTPMEWLITACIDFLERHGLRERNLFAVSAVDDLVRAMSVPVRVALPSSTDPHVAAGAIKAKIRHADEPLIAKACLRDYIDNSNTTNNNNNNNNNSNSNTTTTTTQQRTEFKTSVLSKTITDMTQSHSARRAYILARFMRLLGRVSANIEHSRMNAHCLAKCVAPSMLHWDPNSGFALLMLGKITAYVMAMIEDARVFDEQLCATIEGLEADGGW